VEDCPSGSPCLTLACLATYTAQTHLQATAASHESPSDGPCSDAVTTTFNRALLLSLSGQQASALDLLQPLYARVDGLHEGQALRLCLLMVEILLASGQHVEAAGVLHYLEHNSGLVSPAPGTSGSARVLEEPTSTSPAPERLGSPLKQRVSGSSLASLAPHSGTTAPTCASGAVAASAGPDDQGPNAGAVFLPTVSRCESALMAKVQAVLLQHDRQQQKPPVAIQPQPPTGQPATQQPPAVPPAQHTLQNPQHDVTAWCCAPPSARAHAPDVKLLLRLYKARLHLASHNFKAAKKELRVLLTAASGWPAAVSVRAQLQAARGQPRKALRTLLPLLGDPRELAKYRVELLNDLGVLHHLLGKHQTALLYLQKALESAVALPAGCAASVQCGEMSSRASQAERTRAPVPQPAQQAPKGGGGSSGKGQRGGAAAGSARASASGERAAPALAEATSGPVDWEAGLPSERQHALYYNAGLQHLMLQDFASALECFGVAAQM